MFFFNKIEMSHMCVKDCDKCVCDSRLKYAKIVKNYCILIKVVEIIKKEDVQKNRSIKEPRNIYVPGRIAHQILPPYFVTCVLAVNHKN